MVAANLEQLGRGDPPKFDEGTDIATAKYAGAISQADKGNGRLVVLGSPTFMFNRYLDFPEPTLARRGTYVARFPANGELFINSVVWASGQDALLAISPAAMEVSRLRDMSNGQLIFARVLIVGAIPLAVLFAAALLFGAHWALASSASPPKGADLLSCSSRLSNRPAPDRRNDRRRPPLPRKAPVAGPASCRSPLSPGSTIRLSAGRPCAA